MKKTPYQGVMQKNLHSRDLITILFYIRITQSKNDEVVGILLNCLQYIFQKERMHGVQVVGTIYMEKWSYDLIESDVKQMLGEYCNGDKKRI